MSQPTVDVCSLAAIPIEMFFDQTHLAVGTGFLWHDAGLVYLITNWHNVSGKNPHTGKHLSKTLAEPNRLLVHWVRRGERQLKVSLSHSLRDDDDRPLWFVHPRYKREVDIVALPVRPTSDVEPIAINQHSNDQARIEVGMETFILGYPYGIGSSGLPVWKRASIASEPEIISEQNVERYLLVDTASRPGMSGAPVIRKAWGPIPMVDGSTALFEGAVRTFVGVYSGRLETKDPLDAQLGMVWPAGLVSDIVAGQIRDDYI